jgi:hypothetical protein
LLSSTLFISRPYESHSFASAAPHASSPSCAAPTAGDADAAADAVDACIAIDLPGAAAAAAAVASRGLDSFAARSTATSLVARPCARSYSMQSAATAIATWYAAFTRSSAATQRDADTARPAVDEVPGRLGVAQPCVAADETPSAEVVRHACSHSDARAASVYAEHSESADDTALSGTLPSADVGDGAGPDDALGGFSSRRRSPCRYTRYSSSRSVT